ncbi:membrane protein [Virgisporangium aliadipatigenens]|uniref:Membrane protein n=1 Tax=Virgisporangium aliadipatigenens TaxID=741659 RepID=A0A8J3YKX4_9ACTN|nr:metallophosphoesterase [Virgisporangium aliadipatigenens]GIJ45683.1 membrane protein [Virgisporangium aliadipatigenens]
MGLRSVLRAVRKPFTRERLRRFASACGLVAVSIVGIVIGILVAGHTDEDLGPFRAEYSITPSLYGGSEVVIPPLGSLHLDSHHGPAHLRVRLETLDQKRTQALVKDPAAIEQASDRATEDVARGVRRLIWKTAGASVLGAMILSALIYRNTRRVAGAGSVAVLLLLSSGVAAAGTFRPDSIQEPRFEGLLANAPAVVGDARRIADRYEEYQKQLQRMVANVGRIYSTVSGLPVYEPDATTTRVLHVSDLHLNPAAWSVMKQVVAQFNINFIIDTGDINDWGSQPEASYVGSISDMGVPYVYVRGNHDSELTAQAVARNANAKVLDNQVIEVNGLVIAGIGDPRFTPDKTASSEEGAVEGTGQSLAVTMANAGRPVDIALVHDPLAAAPLAGACPVVLAGHRHKRNVERIGPESGPIPKDGRTILMTQGSTGGAGLRGLEKEEPTPLALSVLYFDQEHKLQAYDDITLGGTGQSEVSLQRNIVRPDEAIKGTPTPSPSTSESGSPAPSGSAPPPSGSPTPTPFPS